MEIISCLRTRMSGGCCFYLYGGSSGKKLFVFLFMFIRFVGVLFWEEDVSRIVYRRVVFI